MPLPHHAVSDQQIGRRRWYVRAVAIVLAAVLAWHMVASFVWSSGSSPIRNAIGDKTLSGYMLPMFGQSWSVFAPNPIRSNTSFDVRALKDGTKKPTEWYSVSGQDVDQAIKHHLLPSRLYLTNFQLISHYRSAFDALNDDGQAAVGHNYKGKTWGRELEKQLKDAGANSSGVATYVNNGLAVNALASAIAAAQWGDSVTAVQVRTVNTPVPSYDHRLDDDPKTSSTFIMTGWRPHTTVANVDEKIIRKMYGAKAGNE